MNPANPRLPSGALLLAPMVGITHRAFRELVAEFGGCDLYFTEMTSAAGSAAGSMFERAFLDTGPDPSRCVIQYLATDEASLGKALEKAPESAGIDLNFGCSAPHVERAGGGVSWMRNPEGAARMLRLAREKCGDRSVSAKIRAGYEADYPALLDFCLGLEDAGADWIAVHPRLADQKFRRESDWSLVARLVRDTKTAIVGNGDIRSVEDCRRRLEASRARALMVGREAARRPWFFALVAARRKDPAAELAIDLEATAFRFFRLLESRLPSELRYTRAKRFFAWYADNFRWAHHVRRTVVNAPDLESMKNALARYFAEVPEDRTRVER